MDQTYPLFYVHERYIRMTSDQSCLITNEPKKENDLEYPLLAGSNSFLSYTEEYSPLLQREPTHESTGTNIPSPTDTDNSRQLNRSRSESTLRLVNDTIGKWKREITRLPQLFHNTIPTPRPTEIQYSVFKPPAHVIPLQYIPSAGFLNTGPVTKEKFDVFVNQAKDAIEHGLQPQMIASGSSGSYFIYNTSKKIIAVFKPQDEEPYGPLSPKMTKWIHRNFFPCFFGRSCLIPNTGYIAESAASLIDRQLQSFIVPYTDSVTLSSPSFYYPIWETWENRFKGNTKHRPKIGSFQLFLDEYQCADEFFKEYPFPQSIPQSTNIQGPHDRPSFHWNVHTLQNLREELEKLVILDFIIRNTDRGLDNWMLKIDYDKIDSYGNPRLIIGAIDNGLSFPWKHPNEWRSFPYGWLFLPISIIGQPFSLKTRNHYLPLLTSVKWWEDTTILLREMFTRDAGFKERMFRKQMAVLKGQAWNIVEVLKSPREGPLELARKLRMLVVDQKIEVPINNPISLVMSAMETSILDQPSSENTVNNTLSNNSEFQTGNSSPVVSLPALRKVRDSEVDESKKMNKSLQQNWDQLLNGEIDETAYQLNNSTLLDHEKNVKVRIGNLKQVPQEYHESPVILNKEQNNKTCQIKLISPGTKSVIIERLQPVSSKPPVFTCC